MFLVISGYGKKAMYCMPSISTVERNVWGNALTKFDDVVSFSPTFAFWAQRWGGGGVAFVNMFYIHLYNYRNICETVSVQYAHMILMVKMKNACFIIYVPKATFLCWFIFCIKISYNPYDSGAFALFVTEFLDGHKWNIVHIKY